MKNGLIKELRKDFPKILISKKISDNINVINKETKTKEQEILSKFDSLNSSISSKLNIFESQMKLLRESILTSDIKLINLNNTLNEQITKINNILNQSIIYPGIIGESFKFKTFHEFIDYIINNISQNNSHKEEVTHVLYNYKVKLENLNNSIQNKLDNIIRSTNYFTTKSINECEQRILEKIKIYDEQIKDLSLANVNNLRNWEKNFLEIKKKIKTFIIGKKSSYNIFENEIFDLKKCKIEDLNPDIIKIFNSITDIYNNLVKLLRSKIDNKKLNNKTIESRDSFEDNDNDLQGQYINKDELVFRPETVVNRKYLYHNLSLRRINFGGKKNNHLDLFRNNLLNHTTYKIENLKNINKNIDYNSNNYNETKKFNNSTQAKNKKDILSLRNNKNAQSQTTKDINDFNNKSINESIHSQKEIEGNYKTINYDFDKIAPKKIFNKEDNKYNYQVLKDNIFKNNKFRKLIQSKSCFNYKKALQENKQHKMDLAKKKSLISQNLINCQRPYISIDKKDGYNSIDPKSTQAKKTENMIYKLNSYIPNIRENNKDLSSTKYSIALREQNQIINEINNSYNLLYNRKSNNTITNSKSFNIRYKAINIKSQK